MGELKAGERIGPYRICAPAPLGTGGMMSVYKAFDTRSQKHCALKVLHPALDADEFFPQHFLKEARIAARLDHLNIAAIYDFSEIGQTPVFLAVELIEGPTLGEYFQQAGTVSLDAALPILEQIAAAIDYTHPKGFLHRDLKPSQVFLERVGEAWRVKVTDFGIPSAGLGKDGEPLVLMGAVEYLSPEQANGARVDFLTDIYALGLLAYEMVCGRKPFERSEGESAIPVLIRHVRQTPPSPLEYSPNLPPQAALAILRALEKEPQNRFASGGEFIVALRAGLESCAERTLSAHARCFWSWMRRIEKTAPPISGVRP